MNVRYALSESHIERFFRRNWKRWYPKHHFVRVEKIEAIRNFLAEFKSLTIVYTVIVRVATNEKVIILHGQARSARHTDPDSPRIAFRSTSYLVQHGFRALLYRPLGFDTTSNLFVYEDLPGTPLLEVLNPKISDLQEQQTIRLWKKYAPEVVSFLKKLHRSQRPSGVPSKPRVPLQHLLQGFQRLTAITFPTTSAAAFSQLDAISKRFPQRFSPGGLKKNFHPTHGDFHLGHALKTSSHLRFIDFGDVAWQDYLFDLGRLIAQTDHQLPHLRDRSGSVRNHIINLYFSKKDQTPETLAAVNYYCIVNVLQIMSLGLHNEERTSPEIARSFAQQISLYS